MWVTVDVTTYDITDITKHLEIYISYSEVGDIKYILFTDAH